MLNYKEVPNNILTGKDLDYLCDIFHWNYRAFKSAINALESVTDEEILDVLKKGSDFFENNMTIVVDTLENRGNINE